jgi:predicted HAD superfamily Cof-like phosphohydrolase
LHNNIINNNKLIKTMIAGQYNKVGEFHQVFGHPIADGKQDVLFDDNKKLASFRISLITEEISELLEAYEANDLVEFVDALSDILYVVYGAGLVFGVRFENAYDVKKVDTNTHKNILQEKKGRLEQLLYSDVGIRQEMEILKSPSGNNISLDLFESLCCRIIKLVYELAQCVQVNIDDCFTEVHRSNMTKVCKTEEDAETTVQWYKINDNRYAEPRYRHTDQYFVVFDGKTSKILKSRKYEEAQPGLAKILNCK